LRNDYYGPFSGLESWKPATAHKSGLLIPGKKLPFAHRRFIDAAGEKAGMLIA